MLRFLSAAIYHARQLAQSQALPAQVKPRSKALTINKFKKLNGNAELSTF